jgi:serine/threonine protein kinase
MLSKYKLVRKISSGSFGEIFSAVHKRTGEQVAIKAEKCGDYSSLKHEARVYNLLKNLPGIPNMKWFGSDANNSYIIIPLFSYNLKELKRMRFFSESDIVSLGKQMMVILENVHKMDVVHCDIKPDNFMINHGSGKLFLIDFGFARKFNPEPKTLTTPVGTPNFMSRSVHSNVEPGFIDDIESSLYVLLFLSGKEVSWFNKDIDNKEILSQKQIFFKNLEEIPHILKTMAQHITSHGRSFISNYNLI